MKRFLPRLLRRPMIDAGPRVRLHRGYSFQNMKEFIVKAWKETYPDEEDAKSKFESRAASKQLQAKADRERREKYESLTEEEIAEVAAADAAGAESARRAPPLAGFREDRRGSAAAEQAAEEAPLPFPQGVGHRRRAQEEQRGAQRVRRRTRA
jgi:hypothetical protein